MALLNIYLKKCGNCYKITIIIYFTKILIYDLFTIKNRKEEM